MKSSRALQFGLRTWLLLPLALLQGCPEDEPLGEPTGAECDPYLHYQLDIAPFMERYCTSCHAAHVPLEKRRGAPGDHDFDSEQGILDNAEHVAQAAAAGPLAVNRSMPPSGSPQPSDAERRLLGQWLACQGEHSGAGHVH